MPCMEEENRTPSFRESFETAGEIFSDSPSLKALAQIIGAGLPGPFGAVLATWGIGQIDQIGKQRLREQLILLAEQLQSLENRAVRLDYFETGEGHDMLIKVLDEARRTRSRLKKELYARILKGAIVDFEPREYSSEEYLYLISDLTEKEIKVAFSVYEQHLPPDDEVWKTWAETVGSQVGMDIADLRFALGRIVSSGLLDRVEWHRDPEVDELALIQFREDEVGFYRVTPGFKKLMRFMGRT